MHKSSAEDIAKIQNPGTFPDKLFYKIGEVGRIVGVESYVLRYWETEFPFLRPRKNKSGQRVYVKKELELLLKIKKLLYEEGYTISGVRKKFAESVPDRPVQNVISQSAVEIIEKIKKRLRDLLNKMQ